MSTTTWRNIILDPVELAEIYEWLDSIPLSRPKGQIEKDFADGVLTAEIVKHYFPQIVDLRSYTQARNLQERMSNWRLLNGKIFTRLGLSVPEHIMTQLSIAKPGIVEVFLYNLRESIRSMMLYRDLDPRLASINMRSLYSVNDPYWYKYNMLAPTDPVFKYADMDLYFYRKKIMEDQARLQLTKSASLRTPRKIKNTKSPAFGYSIANTLPPLITDRNTNNVSKIELEEKTQEILVKEEEIETLRAKLKRLEHLIGLKDARIQDLTSQLEKLKPNKRLMDASNSNSNIKNKTPVNN